MRKRLYILCSILAFSSLSLIAQNKDNVYNESVVVTGSYKPELEDCEKLNTAPQITDTATTLHHNFNYSISTRRLTSLFYPTRIKAARIIGEPTSRLYNTYLRLGMGNYWSPMAEAYYMSTRSQKINYGAYVNHQSSWGTIGKKDKNDLFSSKYYGKNHFSQTDLTIFGRFIVGEHTQIATDLSYENDYNLYYGFNDSTLHLNDSLLGYAHSNTVNYRDSLSTKDYRAMYNRLAWRGGVKSLYTDQGHFGYDVNAEVSNLWTAYHSTELSLLLSGDFHYGFNLGKKQTSKGYVFLHADWQAFRNAATADKLGNYIAPLGYLPSVNVSNPRFANVINVKPYMEFLLKGFKLHAGPMMTVENFTDSTSFHIYPDVSVSKSFAKEALNITLGAEGGFDANSLDAIRRVNPYIEPWADLQGTSHYDFYLRMRVNFSKKLMLKIGGEFNMMKNDLNFKPDTAFALKNVFSTYYCDYNRVKAGGEFSFLNDEMLTISVGGNYYYYTTKVAYHPDYDAYATIGVNYKDKWLFNLQGIVMGNVFAADADGSLIADPKLPMRYGVNFEVEYRHNRALSFFLKFDNLAYQRYYYWLNYPSQRITFLAGVTYTILTKKK